MTKKIKVLLVDDNDDERFFMKEGFLSSGLYEIVAEASSGDELLDMMHTPGFMPPELVFSDLNMPGKNGYEVLSDLKRDDAYGRIPVVILSNAPHVPFAERCRKLGACAYYTKPDTFLGYESFAKGVYQQLLNSCLNGSGSLPLG